MILGIASDHGGFELKNFIFKYLNDKGKDIIDYGTYSEESVDYPDFAHKLCSELLSKKIDRGILICGTGLGMSITANRYKGIRATLSNDLFSAIMSRRHNDSNVLILGGRIVGKELALAIVDRWLEEPFEGERHERRLNKIEQGI